MDTIFYLTFSVNYKKNLPLLHSEKIKCLKTFSMNFNAPNYSEHHKEYFNQKNCFFKYIYFFIFYI